VRRSSDEKSCILEERKKATNRRDDEVAIGVTLNNNTDMRRLMTNTYKTLLVG
jgi:hypothetical protein